MGTGELILGGIALVGLIGGGFLFWRHVWFFRDPPRTPPAEAGILSPADGTVVYVQKAEPGEAVVAIKQGVKATVGDILRVDVDQSKLVIGIFMSPFSVHYNRAPLEGTVVFIHHHAAIGRNLNMGRMHWRTVARHPPLYQDSLHIVQNERTVTLFDTEYRGAPLPLYVVQIGARTVNGIDSYFRPGQRVNRGATFGMIRIGSQVDLVVPWRADLAVRVKPGDKVRAGETVLIQ
jgi:phosphatidylserine decarboxylase